MSSRQGALSQAQKRSEALDSPGVPSVADARRNGRPWGEAVGHADFAAVGMTREVGFCLWDPLWMKRFDGVNEKESDERRWARVRR